MSNVRHLYKPPLHAPIGYPLSILPKLARKTLQSALLSTMALVAGAQEPASIELDCAATVTVNQKPQSNRLTFVYSVRLQENLLIDNKGRRFIAEISPGEIEYAGEFERKMLWRDSAITYKETVYGKISRTTGQLMEGHLAQDINDMQSPPIRTELAGVCTPIAPNF